MIHFDITHHFLRATIIIFITTDFSKSYTYLELSMLLYHLLLCLSKTFESHILYDVSLLYYFLIIYDESRINIG